MAKTVWITGASSGIGKELARLYLQRGDRVILSARNVEALEAVATARPPEVPQPLVLPLDVSQEERAPEWVEKAWSWSGGVDVMVLNAGIAVRATALDTQREVDHKIMQVNYFGTIALAKALLPRMQERESGQLVVVSSLSGKYGVPKLAAYSASKHALHGFFESLRAEIGIHPVKITMLVPGIIKTPITMNALRGDGTQYGQMDKVQDTGITAEKCARQMIGKIDKQVEEAYVGGTEGFTLMLNRFSPSLQRRFIRNHPVKRMRKLMNFWKRSAPKK